MKLDLMLDMETFSTRPNAAILSIALVPFNLTVRGPALNERRYHEHLQMPQQVEAGLHVDPDTALWWMKQDIDARLAQTCAVRERPVTVAVQLLDYFARYKDATVWSYGAAEDNVWLRSFFRAMGYACPVSYRNVGCLRTLARLAGKYGAAGSVTTAHDALADCFAQIDFAQECARVLWASSVPLPEVA